MIESHGDMKERDWNQFKTLEIRKSSKSRYNSKTHTHSDFSSSARRKIESPECDLDLISF